MRTPPTESASVVDIDYANNPDLASIFASKDAGDECRITLEMQVISKTENGIRLGINKVIAEGEGYDNDEAEPSAKEPMIMRLRSATRQERMGFHEGPKGEVPETVQNSLGTTSNV